MHRNDADAVASARGFASLRIEDYPPEELSGYAPPASLIAALPREGYELASYTVTPVRPTRLVDEGDEIDLGDRALTVLHLPGHTPGEIGLWEEATLTLFAGDCVYARDDAHKLDAAGNLAVKGTESGDSKGPPPGRLLSFPSGPSP